MAAPLGTILVTAIITDCGIPTAGSTGTNFNPTISAGSATAPAISSATYNALCAAAFTAAGGSLS